MKPGKYRIKGSSEYFKAKYGDANPEFELEADSREIWPPNGWAFKQQNPTAMLYALRSANEDLPIAGAVYYGKVKQLGELVHESELEVCNP